MRFYKWFSVFCLGTLAIGSMILAQSLTNKPLFEAKSITVIANGKFPKDLECEIFVGPQGTPYFSVQGQENRVNKTSIECTGGGPVISLTRKDGEKDSYALYLFSADGEGKVFGLFDLNFDGQWDVKRSPTRTDKEFILLDGRWFKVDKIEGLMSKSPRAVRDGKQYEFEGTWIPSHR